ncbi:MAG: hypothetical protein QNJ44_07455 [Rhodobacter sp.]|nr:hypothetical protein [Rhodobacter sp.]
MKPTLPATLAPGKGIPAAQSFFSKAQYTESHSVVGGTPVMPSPNGSDRHHTEKISPVLVFEHLVHEFLIFVIKPASLPSMTIAVWPGRTGGGNPA